MSQIKNTEAHLKTKLQEILNIHNLESELRFISNLSSELCIDDKTCAAALLKLIETVEITRPKDKKPNTIPKKDSTSYAIKMVRYRLNIGYEHSVSIEQLRETLIEESGVDKKNINNINIQRTYTLIELPDEMPPDIFQHLKSVEINQCKLDIKRLKPRNNKKRGNNHFRRNRRPDNTTEANQSAK